MMHETRCWCVTPQESPEELAKLLTQTTWTLCTAFEIGGYLFLNDSTSEDAIQEYAIVKRPIKYGGQFEQVESITFGWCDEAKALDYIRQILNGEFDACDYVTPVEPRLETPIEHQSHYCQACA